MTIREVTFILAVVILAFIAWFRIPQWMIKRNARKVVRIFREKNAIGIQNAKTVDDLGIERHPMLKKLQQGKLFGRRDWKPAALDFLIQSNIVMITEDGKLYITEISLTNAAWLNSEK
ncbi:hypothetical protein ACFLTQ_01170 [Chloroflexota bacterium]